MRPFFSKQMPFFGNRAMLVLCAVFFVLPFMLRGAREAIDTMKNDVADWLPKSFDETTELKKFRDNFIGDQFVVVTWSGCNTSDPNYHLLLQKIRNESEAYDEQRRELLKNWSPDDPRYIELKEELEAREWANDLGLHTTGNYHEDWGEHNEKWLLGKNKQWYFINKSGEVFKWDGQNNLIHAIGRATERFFNGKNKATGTFVRQFGTGEGDDNRFYKTPTLLSARFFTDVTTGPEVFEQMAGPGGTIRLGDWKNDDRNVFEAEIETHKRLTGVLFGPTPPQEFDWTLQSLKDVIPAEKWSQLDDDHKFEFNEYVREIVEKNYGGDRAGLYGATQDVQLEYWYRMWQRLQLEPPARQTCLVVTLNDPVLDELARAVGRPVLGKPRGRILELATGQAGIKPDNLHIGGPPVDNVAIDEEGSITLFRLVGLSAVIGLTLAYLSFRSIRVTLMVFFIGGCAAISGLAFVWFGNSTMDAILMTMPSLVYVLGLSGAVHIVNYYRDACREHGPQNAAERAVKLGWFPCTLAAFTTALGLISLYTSNLTPIKKFGLFSAVATMATVIFLFTYLPAALTVWPPKYGREPKNKRRSAFSLTSMVERFWDAVGRVVVKRHALVSILSIMLMAFFAYGITKIETSVQLLKLFRSDAKILRDYHWMENNLGKLVPMELVVNVDADMLKPVYGPDEIVTDDQLLDGDLRLSMLQRMELSERIRRHVLHEFGDEGKQDVGNCMSSDLFSPLTLFVETNEAGPSRFIFNGQLEVKRDDLLEQDYLRVDENTQEELWRISLRLAALNDVDYGLFVAELKTVVEPVLAAYRERLELLKIAQEVRGVESRNSGSVVVIGPRLRPVEERNRPFITDDTAEKQTQLFAETFAELLENAGYRPNDMKLRKHYLWIDSENPYTEGFWESFRGRLKDFDSVVLIEDHDQIGEAELAANAKNFIDARDHRFLIDEASKQPLDGMLTAAIRKADGDPNALVTTTYTGIVPIVYKAQRTLLTSLIKSIMLAFVMIAIVMMILLRPWGHPIRLNNLLNVRAGMLSMLPNVFPIILIFGAMGHSGNLVDIGSMMTASVAMGVAVDDTIHFLNWFRHGIAEGKSRLDSIRLAYKKVATAMTQTTLIGGLGLSAFAFSTFMPTQRFGILMLMLLVAALIGDLIFLPALLAGPLGKLFCPQKKRGARHDADAELEHLTVDDSDDSHKAKELVPSKNKLPAPHMLRNRDEAIPVEPPPDDSSGMRGH